MVGRGPGGALQVSQWNLGQREHREPKGHRVLFSAEFYFSAKNCKFEIMQACIFVPVA